MKKKIISSILAAILVVCIPFSVCSAGAEDIVLQGGVWAISNGVSGKANVTSSSLMQKLSLYLSYTIGSMIGSVNAQDYNYAVDDGIYVFSLGAQRAKEQAILNYAGEGSAIVEHVAPRSIGLYPKSQSYYTEDSSYGDGVCGIAAHIMSLAYYRDTLGYSNIPSDDQRIFRDLLAIYNELTKFAENNFATVFNIAKNNGANNSYEVIGFLETGVAKYLYDCGYTQLAKNVISNIAAEPSDAIGLAKTILSRLFTGLSGWLKDKTDGQVSFSVSNGKAVDSVTYDSLKKGAPVIIGNLAAVGSNYLTNHYFLVTEYYRVSVPGKADKEFAVIYDTWSNYNCQIIDWTVLCKTGLISASSLA